MRDHLGIRHIYLLVGYQEKQVKEIFKDGTDLGVRLEYVEIGNVEKDWPMAFFRWKDTLKDVFVSF